ncbi:S41 family peptidase [Salegentibacter sp. HM20]
MKLYKFVFLFLFSGMLFTSCAEDEDDIIDDEVGQPGPDRNLDVENFMYNGMNEIYLYKADVPELADNYFANQQERNEWLSEFEDPEDLFYNGLTASFDRFSFMTDDYVALEQSFQGTSTTTGMNYAIGRINGGNDLFGAVRYVLPGTSAEEEGLERGMVFTKIDGQQLTVSNYQSLLAQSNFTIHLADINNDGAIAETGETVNLSKAEYTANPVYIAKTLNVDGLKVGYLMYNSFTADFDAQMNQAFAEFKAEGIDELVLDLRYNGGGNVETAVDLSSMITGQFEGEIFSKQQWNATYQNYFEREDAERLVDRFNDKIRTGDLINSLNLTKVYIIATGSSASASELVINGLDAYIDVVHVGTTTVGKFQASITLYDSSNFGRQNANPNHKYAIQPLVYKSANAIGTTDYINGLTPDIEQQEYVRSYGVLGDESEPLLAAALADITGNRSMLQEVKGPSMQVVSETGVDAPDYQRMYLDNVPARINFDVE